ncbi:MAG TPA: helix-turn-helix transcriptional regulator [Allosphingosinicella sp.]|nr:helix-turn-helix transcriptional regulator [Allosphingosinicella sp.]
MTRQDETDLLTAVHDGPFEQPLWATFLERLRRRVRANYAGLIFRRPNQPDSLIELFAGTSPPAALKQVYGAGDAGRNPLPYFELREGRVYASGELLDPGLASHRAFIEDMLEPSGMSRFRLVRIGEPGGVSAWLSIARDAPDFSAGDGALLSALVPHLTRALRAYVAIERERFRADVAAGAMQRLGFGWLSFDAEGRILDSSPHADRLLDTCMALRRTRHGRLTAARPALERELNAALRDCAMNPADRPRALQVSREPWLEMLLVPVQDRPASAAATPVAIAYIQGDNRSSADRHQQIAELFGLLPSEARLALALSRGLNIAEAAAELGLTIETARNYSKKIYAKTGARGQPDLIRFILASVLAFA